MMDMSVCTLAGRQSENLFRMPGCRACARNKNGSMHVVLVYREPDQTRRFDTLAPGYPHDRYLDHGNAVLVAGQ